ncbi:MAG: KpsF/GutQ family sugar-phosphate isomerase [Bacteroidia bacterium]|nr:KpsF/GutQ family sugar-phosphate isomerase [Bacteroidia bacterium]
MEKAIQDAQEVLRIEIEAIQTVSNQLTDSFESLIACLLNCKGRIIVTGVGKSGHIGQKVVATFNSTGTPAMFMHANEAIHGDLGMVLPPDIVIVLSKSGNTPEIRNLVPIIRSRGNIIVGIVGNKESYLAQVSDFLVDVSVTQEACPNNLAPTSSTTATLAACDAIAVCLLKRRSFSAEEFAAVHPGGSLGKKLYLHVSDIMRNPFPSVKIDADLSEIILTITSGRMGATAVLNPNGELAGIITDGDLRRMLQQNTQPFYQKANTLMTPNPLTIEANQLAYNALLHMEKYAIMQLIVVQPPNIPIGMVHLHDIIREGIR